MLRHVVDVDAQEGPVYVADDDALCFTTVVCEQGNETRRARISRIDRTAGAAMTLVDSWHDLPLNSPNDVVVRGDGSVWFTDPSYGGREGDAVRSMERATNSSSTSLTAARTRSQAASTSSGRITLSPSTSLVGGAWPVGD